MALSETSTKLFKHLMQSPPSFEMYLTPPIIPSRPLESETASQPDPSLALTVPVAYNERSQLSSPPNIEMLGILMPSRRQAFSDILNIAFASFAFSPYVLLPQESREHLKLMMTHSSYVDNEAVDLLAGLTQNYWNLREKSTGIDLLNGIAGHFADITQLLRESRPTDIFNRLCALACETAQLLGRVFDEMREFNLAWKYYAFALKMAQEIHDNDLWAASTVRLAELLIIWGEPLEALPFLNEAQRKGIHDPRLQLWLASTEAEIYAMTGSMRNFLVALESSKKITLPASLADDPHRTDVNALTIVKYEGACLIQLRQPERALPLLNEGLAAPDAISIRRRSNLLAEIGMVHAQLGDVKKACELLRESLGMTVQTKSLVTLQRISQGRDELDPWKDGADVKELDAQIVEVYRNLAGVREGV